MYKCWNTWHVISIEHVNFCTFLFVKRELFYISKPEQLLCSIHSTSFILGDPGAVSRVGRKGGTKVFKYGRKRRLTNWRGWVGSGSCVVRRASCVIAHASSRRLLLVEFKDPIFLYTTLRIHEKVSLRWNSVKQIYQRNMSSPVLSHFPTCSSHALSS